MSRSSSEVRDLCNEVEQPFQSLRAQARKEAAQLYVHEEYKAELISALAPELDTRIALPSRRPQVAAEHIQGILRQSLSFHVEPGGARDKDDRRADKRELYYAHEWATNLNKGGRVLNPTYRLQTVGRFVPWWLEFDAFALPKEEDRRDKYRKEYSPFKLSVLDPLTVAFNANDEGEPTIAVRRFNLPYYEIANRYGDKSKDPNPLIILNEQFGWLRGGRGTSIEAADVYGKKAEVCVVDDGVNICHYIDLKDGDQRYHQVGLDGEAKDFENPFGCPSLIIVTGRYNADAELLEDRYQSIISAMLGEQRNVDVMDSHMASLALTPNKHVQQLDKDVARQAVIEDKTIPGVEFDGMGFGTAYGDVVDIGTELPASVTEIRVHRAEDRDAAMPSPFLTNPDMEVVKQGTAAAQLNAFESSNRIYDAPRESLISGVVKVCKMIDHFICEGHLNKKGQPAAAMEKIYFKAAGTEQTTGKYRGENKGQEYEMGPEDYEDGDTLEVTPIAITDSQKMLRYQMAHEQQVNGDLTRERVLETITEDVSGLMEELEEEARYQQWGPMIDNADLLAMVEAIKLDSNGAMDLSMLLNPATRPAAPVAPGQGPSDGGGADVQTTAPPPTTPPPVAAVG